MNTKLWCWHGINAFETAWSSPRHPNGGLLSLLAGKIIVLYNHVDWEMFEEKACAIWHASFVTVFYLGTSQVALRWIVSHTLVLVLAPKSPFFGLIHGLMLFQLFSYQVLLIDAGSIRSSVISISLTISQRTAWWYEVRWTIWPSLPINVNQDSWFHYRVGQTHITEEKWSYSFA